MTKINHGYKILHKYTIDEIFKKLSADKTLPNEIIYNNGDLRDSIKRTQIIHELLHRDGFKCMGCDIKPSYFALGKDNAGRWHLDLYGEDLEQDDHMFTIDHIHPKSKGGGNIIENYQLLCKYCNEKKGDKVEGEVQPTMINTKRHYIDKKLTSLTEQIKGVTNKLKNKIIVCVKEQDGFTPNKEYKVLDFKIRINRKNNVRYEFSTVNDKGEKVLSSFDNFITKVDYIKIKNL